MKTISEAKKHLRDRYCLEEVLWELALAAMKIPRRYGFMW